MTKKEFCDFFHLQQTGLYLLCGSDREILTWFRSLRTIKILTVCWSDLYPSEIEAIAKNILNDTKSQARLIVTNSPCFMSYIPDTTAIEGFFIAVDGKITRLFENTTTLKLLDMLNPGEAFMDFASQKND